MVCNESPDFQQAISHALQQLATPSIQGSLNFQLSTCTSHTRDSVSHRHRSTELDRHIKYVYKVHKMKDSTLFHASPKLSVT